MQMVVGERPKLGACIVEQEEAINNLAEKIKRKDSELSAAIAADEIISEMESQNIAASKLECVTGAGL